MAERVALSRRLMIGRPNNRRSRIPRAESCRSAGIQSAARQRPRKKEKCSNFLWGPGKKLKLLSFSREQPRLLISLCFPFDVDSLAAAVRATSSAAPLRRPTHFSRRFNISISRLRRANFLSVPRSVLPVSAGGAERKSGSGGSLCREWRWRRFQNAVPLLTWAQSGNQRRPLTSSRATPTSGFFWLFLCAAIFVESFVRLLYRGRTESGAKRLKSLKAEEKKAT